MRLPARLRRCLPLPALERLGAPTGRVRWGGLVQAAQARPWLVWPAAVVAYTLIRPLVGFGHEVVVLLLAGGLHACVATDLWQPLIAWLGLDPIYAGAAIRAAGGVQVSGLAVAGALGARLHELAPGWFLAPGLVAPGAGVSMVAAPGAPALGHGLAAFGADVACLALGGWLFWRWRRRAGWIALLGLLLVGQIAVKHLLDAQVSLPDLEASGLPFALAVAMPTQGTWFTADLKRLPPATLDLLIDVSLLVLGLGSAALLLALGCAAQRLLVPLARAAERFFRLALACTTQSVLLALEWAAARRWLAAPVSGRRGLSVLRLRRVWPEPGEPSAFRLRRVWPERVRRDRPAAAVGLRGRLRSATRGHPHEPGRRPLSNGVLIWLGAALGLVTAVSPVGALALGESNWQNVARSAAMVAPAGVGSVVGTSTAGPSVVSIERTGPSAWRYLVNGRPRVIRGVGYNPQYANLDPADRARLYQRDFGAMRQRGINTIEGWFENQFDSVTLDAAASSGIGVLMPFELNQDWPYENPNVQQSILDHVSAYVERYKDHPAVRMWAPGNEDLHRILYPNWVSKEGDPTLRARADAFAAFLPVLVDRIHALDPNHPVIYRDAEDVYLGRLKAAFEQTGVERPWLVYGANVYASHRLGEIVNAWPSQFLPGPLVISEFAPGGVGPAERPLGFQLDWATLRQRPDVVLGGLAYTWATNGPEQLDRVFGLVDPQGQPVDDALAALSSLYLADQAAAEQPSIT